MRTSAAPKQKIQNQDSFEELILYNQLMDFLEQTSEPKELGDGYFKFRGMKPPLGPLGPDHPDYKGSSYDLLVEWETGKVTHETLTQMSMDNPGSCAEYGKKHKSFGQIRMEKTLKIHQDIK